MDCRSMGVYSDYGCLVASCTVQTDKTKESVAEVERQLRLLKDQPISEAELREAKKANLQATASSFETSGALATRLSLLWTWGFPMSAVQEESEGVQKSTLASVRSAAARYAEPGKAILLLVGGRPKQD